MLSPSFQTLRALYEYLKRQAHHSLTQMSAYAWRSIARPNQMEPPSHLAPLGVLWFAWLILAGRGFGKTRTGAETVRQWVSSGRARRIALVGASVGEVRDVMLEGESGLITLSPPQEKPQYLAGKQQLHWPNGAVGYLFNGNYPEKLRGFQFDGAWIDELAKFRTPKKMWDMLLMALRLGTHPKVIITTTPKPLPFLDQLTNLAGVVVTRGSTYDNAANLAPSFIEQMKTLYEGTTLGLQELHAHVMTQHEGALWRRENIRYTKSGN